MSETVVAPGRSGERAAWLGFAGCLIAVFMQMIDMTIVNTALPDLSADIGASDSDQVLIISAYALAFASTLLSAARLGRRVGRRTVFLASVVGFTAASTWCGISDGVTELIVARVAQGVTGAGMAAQIVAIVAAGFPQHRHGQVFAVYGAVSGLAGMLGPIAGGALVHANVGGLGWQTIFLINIPLGVVTFALAWQYLRRDSADEGVSLEIPGMALSALCVFALLYAVADHEGFGLGTALFAAGIAVVAAAAFVARERALIRRGVDPLVAWGLFTERGFSVTAAIMAVYCGLLTAFVFAVSITLQDELGFSALRTGLAMTPFAIGAGVGAIASAPLIQRWGPSLLVAAILLFGGTVAGGAVYLRITGGSVDLLLTVVPVFLSGLGAGLFSAQLPALLIAGLDQSESDAASGLLPTIQQLGTGLGFAALTAAFFTTHTLDSSVSMFLAIAVVAGITGCVALALPRNLVNA